MDRTQLQRLLPHQGDALWIDQVLGHDATCIEGLCDWSHLLNFSSLASPAYLFEAAAQLCAAHGALHAEESADTPPIRMAMVGKLSQLTVHHTPAQCQGNVTVRAEQEALSPAGALYAFSAHARDELLVDGKLLLVLVRD